MKKTVTCKRCRLEGRGEQPRLFDARTKTFAAPCAVCAAHDATLTPAEREAARRARVAAIPLATLQRIDPAYGPDGDDR